MGSTDSKTIFIDDLQLPHKKLIYRNSNYYWTIDTNETPVNVIESKRLELLPVQKPDLIASSVHHTTCTTKCKLELVLESKIEQVYYLDDQNQYKSIGRNQINKSRIWLSPSCTRTAYGYLPKYITQLIFENANPFHSFKKIVWIVDQDNYDYIAAI